MNEAGTHCKHIQIYGRIECSANHRTESGYVGDKQSLSLTSEFYAQGQSTLSSAAYTYYDTFLKSEKNESGRKFQIAGGSDSFILFSYRKQMHVIEERLTQPRTLKLRRVQ